MYIRILFDLLAVGNADHHIIMCNVLFACIFTYIYWICLFICTRYDIVAVLRLELWVHYSICVDEHAAVVAINDVVYTHRKKEEQQPKELWIYISSLIWFYCDK